jgi:hypothetical protein
MKLLKSLLAIALLASSVIDASAQFSPGPGEAGSGTVTSVAVTAPSIFGVSGSPIITSGTIGLTLNSQTANTFFAAPNGSNGAPAFRLLNGADLPAPSATSLGGVFSTTAPANQFVTGIGLTGGLTFSGLNNPGASVLGGVNSATAPANNFQTGISTAGAPTFAQPAFSNLSGTIANAQYGSQTANTVLAAPNGSAGNPSFRALVQPDLPSITSATGTGLSARTLATRASDVINLADFGADPTNTTDSTTAFNNWWTACLGADRSGSSALASGHLCFMPQGHYKVSSNLTWDFASSHAGGPVIEGAGIGATIIDFSGTAGNSLTVKASDNAAIFYPAFKQFSVLANNSAGPAMMIGQANFADAFNTITMNSVNVKNLANSTNSVGLQLNGVFNSDFTGLVTNAGCTDAFGNCPNGGISLRLTQTQFSRFQGSFAGGQFGIHIDTGFTFGNVFEGYDLEVNYTGVFIGSSSANYNTFIGGTNVWCNSAAGSGGTCASTGAGFGIVANAGSHNVFINPNLMSPNTALFNTGNTNGVEIQGSVYSAATPAAPASGVSLTNSTGTRVLVSATPGSGQSITQFCYGPAGTACQNGGVVNGPVSFVLAPGDISKITTSSGTYSWIWTKLN